MYKKFYMHEIADVDLSKIYFLKNAKKACKRMSLMSCKSCKAIRIKKLNCTQQLGKMAGKHLKGKQILSLIVSLQNLGSSAFLIHHRILNAMTAYKIQRKRLLNLLLVNGSTRIPKKSQIVNHASTGFDLDDGWGSIRIELHHVNGTKIFA